MFMSVANQLRAVLIRRKSGKREFRLFLTVVAPLALVTVTSVAQRRDQFSFRNSSRSRPFQGGDVSVQGSADAVDTGSVRRQPR